MWRMCNRAVRIQELRYRCLDVSGKLGTYTYNGILASDDGWWVFMMIEHGNDPLRTLYDALEERNRELGRHKPKRRRAVALAA